MKRLVLAPLALAAILSEAAAQESETSPASFPLKKPDPQSWSFAGIFGKYNTEQLRRGFQVYREVCSACHALKGVVFRNLGEPGGPHFTEAEVEALADSYVVMDGPNSEGEMFERPGRPSDTLPSPFINEEEAAAANGGTAPPDLTLITKERRAERGPLLAALDFVTQYDTSGPDYVQALLTGYDQTPPPGLNIPEGRFYNPYFLSAASLVMPPVLADSQVQYNDDSPQTVDQYSRDVSAFLMWTAEPQLKARERIGLAYSTIHSLIIVPMIRIVEGLWPTSITEAVLGKSGAAAAASPAE